jgi:hypothetical protein
VRLQSHPGRGATGSILTRICSTKAGARIGPRDLDRAKLELKIVK